MSISKCLNLVVVLLLAGCAAAPPSKGEKGDLAAFKTTAQCSAWIYQAAFLTQVKSIAWSGECLNGDIVGKGILIVTLKQGGQEKFTGSMFNGSFLNGTFVRFDGISFVGQFDPTSRLFSKGQRLSSAGRVTHNGNFTGFGQFRSGTVYLENGESFEGIMIREFSFDKVDYVSGKGILKGELVRNGQPVRWYVSERAYATEREFDTAEKARQEQTAKALAESLTSSAALVEAQKQKGTPEIDKLLATPDRTAGTIFKEVILGVAQGVGQYKSLSESTIIGSPQTSLTPHTANSANPARAQTAITIANTNGSGEDASTCINVEERASAISTRSIINKCSYKIELAWCFEGGGSSDDCVRGFRNLWTLGSGATYPIQGKNVTKVRYAACKGANSLTLRGGAELHM